MDYVFSRDITMKQLDQLNKGIISSGYSCEITVPRIDGGSNSLYKYRWNPLTRLPKGNEAMFAMYSKHNSGTITIGTDSKAVEAIFNAFVSQSK